MNFGYRKYVIFSIWIQNGSSYMLHARRKTFEQDLTLYLAFPFKCGKAISWRSRRLKSQKKSCLKGNTDFSKLVNWLVTTFSLISIPVKTFLKKTEIFRYVTLGKKNNLSTLQILQNSVTHLVGWNSKV